AWGAPRGRAAGGSGRANMLRTERGRRGERLAAAFLELQGYEIVAHNARVAGIELDLVARHGAALVVVEVKSRASARAVAADALAAHQRLRLRRAAETLLRRDRSAATVRIDMVGIDVRADGAVLQHWRAGAAPAQDV